MSKNKQTVSDDHGHDRVFVATFLGILAVLVGIAVVIGVIANNIDNNDGLDPVTLEKTAQRLEPVAQVYTDASQMPAPAAAPEADSRSAEEVVQTVCAACHNSGLLGAPKVGDKADWAARLKAEGGLSGIQAAAIAGKGSMPPRGGDASLSDEQMDAAVVLLSK